MDLPRAAEWLRKAALAFVAGLIVARAYWPGENASSGSGLGWVGAVLIAFVLAVASWFIGGTVRFRFSWADGAALAALVLVLFHERAAADQRVAITLSWECIGLGLVYMLVRCIPRDSSEHAAIAGSLAATAVALSVYALYQIGVEFPEARRLYLANPKQVLRSAGIPADASIALIKGFENRLLGSREPIATFALANSLAGYLVGPAVIVFSGMIGLFVNPRLRRERRASLILALPPTLVLLAVLLLTKSRAAYVGFAVGLLVALSSQRGRVPIRALAVGVGGLVATIALVAALAAFAGQLDAKVLSESTKSLRYRWEYWQGAWGVIAERPWSGWGLGNFAGPYLRHKHPWASEEISDPHNLILEVWAGAGAVAAFMMTCAIILGLRNAFAGGHAKHAAPVHENAAADPRASFQPAVWLVACAGLLGWILVVALGRLDPLGQSDALRRWLILGAAWALAALMFNGLRRAGVATSAACGAGALAILINLLGAGGIGFPPVALGLWNLLALGQNLREDRDCGSLRDAKGGRMSAIGIAVIAAALVGTFVGKNAPTWRCEIALAEAEAALDSRQPDFAKAREAFLRAATADAYDRRPWAGLALLEARAALSRPNGQITASDWVKIKTALRLIGKPPRDPNSIETEQARIALLQELIDKKHIASLDDAARAEVRNELVNSLAKASRLYPNNAKLRANLAFACVGAGRSAAAAREAKTALQLDDLNPHVEKKLTPDERKRIGELVK